MFRPLIPIISDTLSHTFAEAEHLATVHEKYGNNHLENTLTENGSVNDNQNNNNSIKTDDPIPFHVSVDVDENIFKHFFTVKPVTDSLAHNLPCVFVLKNIPPPKFS